MKMRISREFTFDAAHKLVDYPGKCKRMHGHTYTLVVTDALGSSVSASTTVVVSAGLVAGTGTGETLVESYIVGPCGIGAGSLPALMVITAIGLAAGLPRRRQR